MTINNLTAGSYYSYAIVTDLQGNTGMSQPVTFTIQQQPDTDGDGLIDAWEMQWFGNLYQSPEGDFDDDHISNAVERNQGTNPTSAADGDSDDLPDDWELFWFGGTAQSGSDDADSDHVSNFTEFTEFTNPITATDSDTDDLPDDWETHYFGDLVETASGQFDGDKISNGEEFNQYTDPSSSADGDNDAMPNDWEKFWFDDFDQTGTADFDNDKVDNATEFTLGTNPTSAADGDGDDMPDDWELHWFGNLDHDATTNADNDGLSDVAEFTFGSAPNNTDTDGDSLSDGDEQQLGANPNNPDTDGDGLTDGQEQRLGTNPNTGDNPGYVQGTITNGDFSQGTIGEGKRIGATAPITWDYWEGGIEGWTAVTGTNVELQTIESSPAGNAYCELKAHPAGNSGIKQQICTTKDTTYCLVLDCKDRADVAPGDSNFDIKIDGVTVKSINFDAHKGWETHVVSFKATDVTTELSLVPTSTGNTTGGLVDNIRLAKVEVEQQNYSVAQGIRFCRWLDAFYSDDNGVVSFDPEFADKDRDRFRIKISSIIPNLTKIRIQSTGLDRAMIDGDLVGKSTDGDYEVEMKAENGVMVSTPILLVSDGDDDVAYNGIGEDNEKDDQTLLADFNSKIIVTFPELNNAQCEFSAQKAVGKVAVDIVYLSPEGDLPNDILNSILRHVYKMQEIYRAIGIKVEMGNIREEAVPQSLFDAVSPSHPANHLDHAECTVVEQQIKSHVVTGKQIRIGYVDATLGPDRDNPFLRAYGFTYVGRDGCVVSLEAAKARGLLGVTAHEVGHTLGLDHAPAKLEHLLVRDGLPVWRNGKMDSKRFSEGDFNIIKKKGDFYDGSQ